jgi:hypothetical protein
MAHFKRDFKRLADFREPKHSDLRMYGEDGVKLISELIHVLTSSRNSRRAAGRPRRRRRTRYGGSSIPSGPG